MSKVVKYSRNINVSAEAVKKGGSRVVYVSAEQLDSSASENSEREFRPSPSGKIHGRNFARKIVSG